MRELVLRCGVRGVVLKWGGDEEAGAGARAGAPPPGNRTGLSAPQAPAQACSGSPPPPPSASSGLVAVGPPPPGEPGPAPAGREAHRIEHRMAQQSRPNHSVDRHPSSHRAGQPRIPADGGQSPTEGWSARNRAFIGERCPQTIDAPRDRAPRCRSAK